MGFGIGKLPGANNTHKRILAKMAKQGHTPQEISDRLKVILSAVLSFYQKEMKLSDEEMKKFPLVDTGIASNREALETADKIIADAQKQAADIAGAAAAAPPVAGTEAEVGEEPTPAEEAKDKVTLKSDKPAAPAKKGAKVA